MSLPKPSHIVLTHSSFLLKVLSFQQVLDVVTLGKVLESELGLAQPWKELALVEHVYKGSFVLKH